MTRRTRCDVDTVECTRNGKIVHGMCPLHLYRQKKWGDPHFVAVRTRPPGLVNPLRVDDEVVKRWRVLRGRGWTGTEIAREYGVSRDTVYRRTNVTDERQTVDLDDCA